MSAMQKRAAAINNACITNVITVMQQTYSQPCARPVSTNGQFPVHLSTDHVSSSMPRTGSCLDGQDTDGTCVAGKLTASHIRVSLIQVFTGSRNHNE